MRVCVVIFLGFLCVLLFRKAAGGLSPKRMNIITLVFVYTFVTNVIGGSLLFLGFRDNYMLVDISQKAVDYGYFTIMYTILAIPLVVIVFSALLPNSRVPDLTSHLGPTPVATAEPRVPTLVTFLTCLSAGCAVYSVYFVGGVPLLELIRNFGENFNAQAISNSRAFRGNVYIRNIGFILTSKILAYVSYVFIRVKQTDRPWLLFVVNFSLALIAVTFDYSKSPIAVFILGFFLIEVCLGRIKSIWPVVAFVAVGAGLVLVGYAATGFTTAPGGNGWFSLSTGPVSRLLIGQNGGVFLTFDTFPTQVKFLNGASLPEWMGSFLGIPNAGTRSGRILMEVYNPAGVRNETAGVINSLASAEAYANWGPVGIFITPIIIGFYITLIHKYVRRGPDNPFGVALYVVLSTVLAQTLEGGIIDFIYNASVIYLIVVFLLMQWLSPPADDGGHSSRRPPGPRTAWGAAARGGR